MATTRTRYQDIAGPLPGKFLALTHGKTHYQLQGPEDGPLVILQHGLGGNTAVWDGIAKDLVEQLNARVLRYDFYERGYSETESQLYPIARVGDPHPLRFSMSLYLTQMREVILSLGLESTDFVHVGHSMGGTVGLAYAARYTQQVKGLVFVDAVCLPPTKPLTAHVADLPLIGNVLVRNLGSQTFVKFARKSCTPQADEYPGVKKFLEYASRNALENPRFFASIRSTNGNCLGFRGSAEHLFRKCCQSAIPMHFVWGKGDLSAPYQDCIKLRAIASELGMETTETSFDNMPHNVFFADAKPKECSTSILSFVTNAYGLGTQK